MTEFMVPTALPQDILNLRAPTEDQFDPFGDHEVDSKEEIGAKVSDEAVLSEKWYNYLQQRYVQSTAEREGVVIILFFLL